MTTHGMTRDASAQKWATTPMTERCPGHSDPASRNKGGEWWAKDSGFPETGSNVDVGMREGLAWEAAQASRARTDAGKRSDTRCSASRTAATCSVVPIVCCIGGLHNTTSVPETEPTRNPSCVMSAVKNEKINSLDVIHTRLGNAVHGIWHRGGAGDGKDETETWICI